MTYPSDTDTAELAQICDALIEAKLLVPSKPIHITAAAIVQQLIQTREAAFKMLRSLERVQDGSAPARCPCCKRESPQEHTHDCKLDVLLKRPFPDPR